MMHRILFMTSSLVLNLICSQVLAQEVEPTPTAEPEAGPISAVLGDLSWGATEAQVLKDAEMRLDREWEAQRKDLDTLGMDELRRVKREEFKAIQSSLTRFDGTKSGFESSIVGSEYQRNRNESVLMQTLSGQKRYYFFRDQSLWKIAVIMDANRSKGLQVFAQQVDTDFGKSSARTYRMEAGKKMLDTVTWTGPVTVATAIDKRGVFNAYMMRFVQVGRGEGFQKELDERPKAKTTEDAMLTDLFDGEDLGASQAESSLVDELTGESHELDRNRGVVEDE